MAELDSKIRFNINQSNIFLSKNTTEYSTLKGLDIKTCKNVIKYIDQNFPLICGKINMEIDANANPISNDFIKTFFDDPRLSYNVEIRRRQR
ncbi:MAG: hypothetical protein KKF48_02320 [Nanoarchaeota archaeon]|nr:hypothetical protein [Nanoarchaeota archaeon]MBU1027855.1 hypothetical protein [Nanoarchaeota archaeon]